MTKYNLTYKYITASICRQISSNMSSWAICLEQTIVITTMPMSNTVRLGMRNILCDVCNKKTRFLHCVVVSLLKMADQQQHAYSHESHQVFVCIVPRVNEFCRRIKSHSSPRSMNFLTRRRYFCVSSSSKSSSASSCVTLKSVALAASNSSSDDAYIICNKKACIGITYNWFS